MINKPFKAKKHAIQVYTFGEDLGEAEKMLIKIFKSDCILVSREIAFKTYYLF